MDVEIPAVRKRVGRPRKERSETLDDEESPKKFMKPKKSAISASRPSSKSSQNQTAPSKANVLQPGIIRELTKVKPPNASKPAVASPKSNVLEEIQALRLAKDGSNDRGVTLATKSATEPREQHPRIESQVPVKPGGTTTSPTIKPSHMVACQMAKAPGLSPPRGHTWDKPSSPSKSPLPLASYQPSSPTCKTAAPQALSPTASTTSIKPMLSARKHPTQALPIGTPIGQAPQQYKSAARRVTLAIVAMPIAIVTSWVLYDRMVLGAERKLLVQPPERTESSLGLK